MTTLRIDETQNVREDTTHTYATTITDENEQGLGPADLDALTLTLYDVVSGDIINSRDAQSVLNANGGTLEANGDFTWLSEPDDMPILEDSRSYEEHIGVFEWAYPNGSGAKKGNRVVRFIVANSVKVP